MKKLFFLLGLAFSLMFSGFAVADQVVSCPGVVKALPAALPDLGSPFMAAAPLLLERIRLTAREDRLTYTSTSTMTGIAGSASPTAFDTGDPRTVATS